MLGSGTPLALQFAFGDVCYLNISAQVVFCLASQTPGKHAMGIKFSAIREWERTILVSSIQELKESTAIQKKSLLNILVCKDTFALEVADFRIGQFSHEKTVDRKLRGGISKADLMPKQKKIDYTAEAARARREWLSQKTGAELKHIAVFSEDPDNMRGNVENLIGVAQIPIGVAGPLNVNGQYAQGKYYVPMATTEGALVYTINQGMLIVSLAGGVTTTLL